MMNIVLILGTAHKGRASENVFHFMEKKVKERGSFSVGLLDIANFTRERTGDSNDNDKDARAMLEKTDGYIIVSPEYNRGYPGELKLFLDTFYTEYTARPVGFCGVSSGAIGGARAVEQLKLVALDINMIPMHQHLYFACVQELFDDNGIFIGKSMDDEVKSFLNELEVYATHLQDLRRGLLKK